MTRDPTGHIQSVMRKKALDTVRQLRLLSRDGDESGNEVMLVTMHFEEDPNSRTGAIEVHVSGSLPDRLFASGEFSKPIMEKLGSFFGKFKGSYHSAHREVEKAAASAAKSKESDKT